MSRATAPTDDGTPQRVASANAHSFSMPSPSRQNSNSPAAKGAAPDGAAAEPRLDETVGELATAANDADTDTIETEAVDDSEAEAALEGDDEENTTSTQNGTGGSSASPADAARAQFLEVLQRAKEGDRKAFEEIYQLYHRRIYNAVYGMLSDADDAQDVTQDVFIRLHDALPTLRADEAFSTYLYRIALNLCRDRARRKKRVRFQSMDTPRTDSEGEVEPMEFPDLGKLPEETIAGEELQRRVRQAVQNLSDDHKAVIVMHHFQGMEVNDIANILGVPTGTVKSRLARGRDQLHRKLRGYLNV
jgi:RNA polymerase sigma-70 factor (ECF subfamily)